MKKEEEERRDGASGRTRVRALTARDCSLSLLCRRVADPRNLQGCGDPRTLFLKRVRGGPFFEKINERNSKISTGPDPYRKGSITGN